MTTKDLVKKVSFGESIAEMEAEDLKKYFLQTEFWESIRHGGNDIVYGAKGAGKSALYTSLTNDIEKLFEENILVALAENPTGATAFSGLTTDPPTSESQFVRLWKLYFLVITVSVLNDFSISSKEADEVRKILVDCNLIPAQNKLASFLKSCFDFLKSFAHGKEISTTAEFDPVTGLYSGQKFSLSFGEPSKTDFDRGLIPIEYVYDLLKKCLRDNGIALWIIIDRLDVAFVDNEGLEINALRALFKAYLDLAGYKEIRIKIFLRDDIWRKISAGGFREASHITKYQHLSWTREALLNLLIRRVLNNEELLKFFDIDRNEILSDIRRQEELFYRLFPSQIDIGKRKSKTLDWVLSRTRDGKGINTPRELIQLFSHARAIEAKLQDNGINNLVNENILSRQAIKEAVDVVSKQRLEQTMYAEYPALKDYIELLKGDKAEHSIPTLALKWGVSNDDATQIANNLSDIGFFETVGDRSNLKFKIPFLYRPYLSIIQGAATTED